MRRYLVLALMIATALPLADCSKPDGPAASPSGLTQAQFVDLYMKLWEAQQVSPDSATYEARKKKILADAGITERHLTLFVREHSGDVKFMTTVWDSVHERLGGDTGRTIVQ